MKMVILLTAVWVTSAALGWSTAPTRTESSTAPYSAQPMQGRSAKSRPRILKLRALDTTMDIEQLQSISAPEVARFGAKKWTEILGRQADMIKRGFGPVVALDDYFAGWQAITAETSPYSTAQFQEGLQAELCNRSPLERDLLQQSVPTLSLPATGPCALPR